MGSPEHVKRVEDNAERVSWNEFVEAVAVFKDDYAIVKHSELNILTPWEEPNKKDERFGQYSLTQIPEEMVEDEFVHKLADVTDIAITCMDRDCAHSTWQKTQTEGRKVMMLTWGGGVVQHNLEGREGAVEAMSTIARYLGQLKTEGKLPKLENFYCDDHDSVCGAVKTFLGGKPLHEYLSQFLGREITEHSPEEDRVMEMFIRHGAQVFVNVFASTSVRVMARLHYTDRQDPENNSLTDIELGTGLPEMDVAAFIEFVRMSEML